MLVEESSLTEAANSIWPTLAAVVLGGLLAWAGQWVQTILQERSAIRRRNHDAARMAQQIVLAYVRRVGEIPSDRRTFEQRHEFEKLTDDFSLQVISITDDTVRGRLLWIGEALHDLDSIYEETFESVESVARRLKVWTESVVGAYLRSEDQPAESADIARYREALVSAYARYAEQAELEEEYRRERREGDGSSS
ncbi:hypothetical protein [Jiangella alkaliphila]|uniref:Uncharacterized protein n=1 Tax=Jiangella alkaliphila TaxID=419479 RepID=A0A1H2GAF9_9ACTN|nr:hypothetical protein [Jiangella alkaliphila]SDU16643.1 hypothetical protein SAMN04488563_0391 [Jiangella alkaliphila]